ncbi:hypothetical protein NPIL_355581 [Nephila pilipes]|uniref:Uncharacterized protein n=1 Tax=Nephila pilipes TaxID=299642 RepID=A0A8X6QSM3_NEPPI|nr:hypothetical protein NPIL_355581 [Nephila pilipes]
MQGSVANTKFPSCALFKDEASFNVFNVHILQLWALHNPQDKRGRTAQQPFAVNMWNEIISDCFLERFLILPCLDAMKYLTFLATVSPNFLNEVPPDIRQPV